MEKLKDNINPAWWNLATILKRLPKPGRHRSDSEDSEATLVGDPEEEDEFTKLVRVSKKNASPRRPALVRHISWAREPVKPPNSILVTNYDTGECLDLSVNSDYEGPLGPRGRTPSPYPGRKKDVNSNGLESEYPTPRTSTTARSIPQPRTPSPSGSRRKPTRSTCQCPPCAAAASPRRTTPPRSRPGWVATDPSRWDDGGASAPRLMWVSPAAEPLVLDPAGTGVIRYVSTVRPGRGRTAGRGHPVWAPSHSPAPGWMFADDGDPSGVDARELAEALKEIEAIRTENSRLDAAKEVDKEEDSTWKNKRGYVGSDGGGSVSASRRDATPCNFRRSWGYGAQWETNCYSDMFRMHLE